MPAIEDQLLIRKYFCSSSKGKKNFSLADIVIYHELYTALAYSSIAVDERKLPHTAEWTKTLTSEWAINS